MQSMKETAANIGASAKAGMEKTKAVVQEKVEKASAHDPVQKQMAREKKEQKIAEAEAMKHGAKAHNAAATQGGHVLGAGYTTTTGATHDYVDTPGHHHGTTANTVAGGGGGGYGTIGDYGGAGAAGPGAYTNSVGGETGYTTGTHQMPGHNSRVGGTTGTGQGHLPGYGIRPPGDHLL